MKKVSIAAIAALMSAAACAAMCKMPTCKESAIEKSQFCERHTCATAGCNMGVKIGGVPGWVAGNQKKRNSFAFQMGPEQELPTKIVWRHCPKHACGRLLPKIENSQVRSLIAGKDQDEVLRVLACDHERLFKGKFCLRHSCGVANCASAVFEEWSKEAKKSTAAPSMTDLKSHEFCPRHLAIKGDNKHPREGLYKETCSEYYERKQAEKQALKEKEAAAAKK